MAAPDRIHLELECVLDDAEVRQAGKRLSEVLEKQAIIKDRLAQEKAKVKAELAILEAHTKKYQGMVRTERETREVLCAVTYDWKKGEKTFVRVDTGEVARVENITPAERQKEIE